MKKPKLLSFSLILFSLIIWNIAAQTVEQSIETVIQTGHYAAVTAVAYSPDGKVTIFELRSYLEDQVPELSKKYKAQVQYPYTFSIGHDFPLVFK